MSVADTFLPEFDHETANTRKALERVPADKYDVRPHEKSWSLIELASHIARLPGWVPPMLQEDGIDLAATPRLDVVMARARVPGLYGPSADEEM